MKSRAAHSLGDLQIRRATSADRPEVTALWRAAGLARPWNDPDVDFDRKLAHSPWGLLVGEQAGRLVATAMAGYDGHRGSVNYLCVEPSLQRYGLGGVLMDHVEALLLARGCPKINLDVRADNAVAAAFYAARGYTLDAVSSYGLRLIPDGLPHVPPG